MHTRGSQPSAWACGGGWRAMATPRELGPASSSLFAKFEKTWHSQIRKFLLRCCRVLVFFSPPEAEGLIPAAGQRAALGCMASSC